jgi:hypothetical protein
MRIRGESKDGFLAGFFSAFVVLAGLVLIGDLVSWLGDVLRESPVERFIAWTTSEQSITYVPYDLFFGLLGVILFLLILYIIVFYMAFGPRVNT